VKRIKRENPRQRKKQVKKTLSRLKKHARQEKAIQAKDADRFDAYAATPNGSARLVAFHDAVLDADDTLEAVDRAIADDDLAEARRLIDLGRESLKDRLTELKDLL
jgi:hypothetical protein